MSKSEEAKLTIEKAQNQTLHVLYGKSGSGKSTLLDAYVERHSNKIKLYRPETKNAPLTMVPDDYLNHVIIAVDELFMWDYESIPRAIRTLEQAAIQQRKSLIVTVQNPDDIRLLGINLISSPVLIAVNNTITTEYLDKLAAQHNDTEQT